MTSMFDIDWTGLVSLLAWVSLVSFVFAKVEIQIEGKQGWASALPTWRIEKHWLLDLFWGGRPMTGYHAWMFFFILLMFHLGFAITGIWTWVLEFRVLAAIAMFWLIEDFLWFVLNPDYGIKNFTKTKIPWHPRWFLGMPADYWVMGSIGIAVLVWSFAS